MDKHQQALRPALTSDLSPNKIAAQRGLSRHTIRQWRAIAATKPTAAKVDITVDGQTVAIHPRVPGQGRTVAHLALRHDVDEIAPPFVIRLANALAGIAAACALEQTRRSADAAHLVQAWPGRSRDAMRGNPRAVRLLWPRLTRLGSRS